MKKFVLFIIFLICFLVLSITPSKQEVYDSLLAFGGDFSVYGVGFVECIDTKIVQNGSSIIATTTCDNSKNLIENFNGDVWGQSVCFKTNGREIKDFENALNVKIRLTQQVGKILIAYAYSSQVECGVLVNGETINMQIAINNDCTTIGIPLILGSF